MNKKVSYTYQYLSRTETKIKEFARVIYNIIQSVTEKLSSLPYIEGIVLRQPLLRSCSKRPRRFLGSGADFVDTVERRPHFSRHKNTEIDTI